MSIHILHINSFILGLTRFSVTQNVCRELKINIEEPVEVSNDVPSTSSSVSINNTSAAKRTKYLESLILSHCPNAIRNNVSIEFELQSFREAPTYTNPLAFWKKHHSTYPKLASVARVVLGFPLTTAKSEGSFSTSGCLIRSRRASITPTRVEKVLLIHDNFHLLK